LPAIITAYNVNTGHSIPTNTTNLNDLLEVFNWYDIMGNGFASFFNNVPSVSVVHLSFPQDMDINLNSMWADVQVASTYNLGGVVAGGGALPGSGELGDIYIQAFHLNIKAGSWVDIWAH
jgi:hypothetical protein